MRTKSNKKSWKIPVSSKANKPESTFKGKFPIPNPLNNKKEIEIDKKEKLQLKMIIAILMWMTQSLEHEL